MRLLTIPLALVLGAVGCDQPEGTCEPEPVDLVLECGFAEEYAARGELDGNHISARIQRYGDRNVWMLLGTTQGGQMFGVEVHPRDCSGEFAGEWSSEDSEVIVGVRFEGTITEDEVVFDRFSIGEFAYDEDEPSFPTYEGLLRLPARVVED